MYDLDPFDALDTIDREQVTSACESDRDYSSQHPGSKVPDRAKQDRAKQDRAKQVRAPRL
jgi:hypothetical protein